MKSIILLVILAVNLKAINQDQYLLSKGRTVYDNLCSSCHTYAPPVDRAPPFKNIIKRYHELFLNKDSAITYLMNFIKSPSLEKSVTDDPFMIERFGLMPQVSIEPKEREAVAAWFWHLNYNPAYKERLQITLPSFYSSEFEFLLPGPLQAILNIYLRNGTLVNEIKSEHGTSSITWDGKDKNGADLSKGRYDFLITQNGLETMGTINLLPKGESASSTLLQNGFLIYMSSCLSCHQFSNSTSIAPSIKAISEYYHNSFSAEDISSSYIANYVQSPSLYKSKLPAAEHEKYDLMLPILRMKEDLTAVSAWIWEAYNQQNQFFTLNTTVIANFGKPASQKTYYFSPSTGNFILRENGSASATIFRLDGKILKFIEKPDCSPTFQNSYHVRN